MAQHPPGDSAPTGHIVRRPTGGATMNDETPEDDDVALVVIRQVGDLADPQSFKQMFLFERKMKALGRFIHDARRPPEQRRRLVTIGLGLTTGLALDHYWQALSTLAHLVH
jgi:hypothetical protein